MNRIAALVLSALACFTFGCAHQRASLHVDDSEKVLPGLHEQWAAARVNRAGKSDSDVVKPEYIRHVDMRVSRIPAR